MLRCAVLCCSVLVLQCVEVCCKDSPLPRLQPLEPQQPPCTTRNTLQHTATNGHGQLTAIVAAVGAAAAKRATHCNTLQQVDMDSYLPRLQRLERQRQLLICVT